MYWNNLHLKSSITLEFDFEKYYGNKHCADQENHIQTRTSTDKRNIIIVIQSNSNKDLLLHSIFNKIWTKELDISKVDYLQIVKSLENHLMFLNQIHKYRKTYYRSSRCLPYQEQRLEIPTIISILINLILAMTQAENIPKITTKNRIFTSKNFCTSILRRTQKIIHVNS